MYCTYHKSNYSILYCMATEHKAVCLWTLVCRSQPDGSTAHKSATPIHLSGILATGNTSTIIQWLQAMVCKAWYFSWSVRAFSKAAKIDSNQKGEHSFTHVQYTNTQHTLYRQIRFYSHRHTHKVLRWWLHKVKDIILMILFESRVTDMA